jgi:hypothetical protein
MRRLATSLMGQNLTLDHRYSGISKTKRPPQSEAYAGIHLEAAGSVK